jgi:hypothetical protein
VLVLDVDSCAVMVDCDGEGNWLGMSDAAWECEGEALKLGWSDSDSEVEGELEDACVDFGAGVTIVQKSNLNC